MTYPADWLDPFDDDADTGYEGDDRDFEPEMPEHRKTSKGQSA